MKLVIKNFIIALFTLYLAQELIEGVYLGGNGWIFLKNLLISSVVLTILKTLVQPILNILVLPLQIITLGAISFFISLLTIWLTDVFVPQLAIVGFLPLFWTGVIWLALRITAKLF